MKENLDVFDFELTEADKNEIATLNEGESQFFSHADPEMMPQNGCIKSCMKLIIMGFFCVL